jgi:DNA-binding winged helix-turn-helix (wHTH) protein/tetratricopeptide (TPR) repeat protein
VIHRFGQFELDESKRELRDEDGHRIDTEPKAFELLLYLLKHRDRAVSKDELLTELWPRSIVTETALSRCVMKARRAVGDDSDRQSVIMTVHGHGYRFAAEVLAERGPEPELQQEESPAVETPAGRRARWLAGAALALLAVIAGGLYLETRAPEPQAGTLAVLPVTNLVEDPELAWVRVGLMSLMQRMLEDDGVEVASERLVLNAIGDTVLAAPPDAVLFEKIREQSGAGAVLHTTLDSQGGLHRLSAVLTRRDGRKLRRMIVGDSPAALAADMARVVAGILAGAATRPAGRFSKTSTDPFVNEMYGRALDLELQGRLADARELFRAAAGLEPELFWLRYEIALCTRDLREWDEAEHQFDQLYEEAKNGADDRAVIVTLNSHGIMELNRNNYDAAEKLFEDALIAANGAGHAAERATVHINLALIARRHGDLEDAKRHNELALAAFAEAGEEPAPTFDNNYAGLLAELGDLEMAQQYSERAIDGFRLLGQRRFEAPALNRLAKILRRRGEVDAGIARHNEALAIYRELGDVDGEISVMSALTGAYREKGDLTRAALNAREVNERASKIEDPLTLAITQADAAEVEADLGHYDRAIAGFETARTMFAAIGDDGGRRQAEAGIVLVSIERGDTPRAAELAASMRETAAAAGHESAEARARWLQGRVAEAQGDTAEGIEHYAAALDYARRSGDASMLAYAGTSLAELQLDSGDADAAAVLVEEIRPVAGTRYDFHRLDARLALAQGDTPRATEILSALRTRAGEAWRMEDDELLKSLQP